MKTNKIYCFIFILSLFCIASCHTLKEPTEVGAPLNYTDEDVVNAEIERIEALKAEEPVKALWRAVLLNKEEVIDDCYQLVKKNLSQEIENKNYAEAFRLYTSLKTIRDDSDLDELEDKLQEIYLSNALQLDVGDKSPQNIADCVKATVTIWVDKGLKVENGTGMADIVIGSGFFIDKNGYIITNHHVIEDLVSSKYEGYSRLYVKMQPDTDTKIPAKVIGYDPIIDLALLKVEVEPEVVLSLGSSTDLSIGDKVSAIGTPIGLEGTLTSGIISSVDRKLLTLGNVFQIDAAVNSGNSGGPLIDERMQVQAIVFAGILQFQGLNFAIPVEYLKQELQTLYSGGELKHAWIASYGRTVRKGSQKLGLEVQYVIPGGAACMSGLKEGDVITEAAGSPITSIDDFQLMLMSYEPGTIISVKGKDAEDNLFEKQVYLEVRSDKPNELVYKSDYLANAFIPIFGMKLKGASTTNRYSYIIDKVVRGGTADELGFSEGDSVIVKDMKVDSKNEYVAALLHTKRRNKGYLEIPITLSGPLDSPFYF